MSTMIVHFCFLLPLLFHSIESSSIRGRNNKNELVPLTSSRAEPQEKDNRLKIVSSEPFVIQLHVPAVNETKETKDADKKTKQSNKKRVFKRKSLRKKHRTRRDLRLKPIRDVKSNPLAGNSTERHLKNITKNVVTRMDVLRALTSQSKRRESKRNEPERFLKDLGRDFQIPKHTTGPDRKHRLTEKPSLKLVYPSTPKHDRNSHRYSYKDLMADRRRIEQKINYIKNMFSVNDPTADETVRKRRRTETDRTANKIAKMFLTLSAVNGLQEKRRSKCRHNEDDDDRVQDVWEKERKDSPSRKSTSSNEERYKVKKWIQFLKNKRSSGKTCPCMANFYGEDDDAFPLEQKLPKGYHLMERKGSSEESLESYRDPFRNSGDSPLASQKRLMKDQEKDQSKNAKKKIDLPLTDLELYRSRAKQILRNAEEILDRIKEEEEKRLSSPFMSQLRELTSRIHGDPRNNENDLIRKIQKNLGWDSLAKSKEGSDGNSFVDNVKSYILDPYEKAKALTDESTKMLSSYLLKNLGKMHESSEEPEVGNAEDESDNLDRRQKFPNREKEQADPLAKNKEELQQWEDTISTILNGAEENVAKEADLAKKQEEMKARMEDIMKEQQKKLNDYEMTHDGEGRSKEVDSIDEQNLKQTAKGPEQLNFFDSQKRAENGQPLAEKQQGDLVAETKSPEDSPTKGRGDPGSEKMKEKEIEKEIFDEIIKTVNEAEENVKGPDAVDPQLEKKLQAVAADLGEEKLEEEATKQQQSAEGYETPFDRKPAEDDRDETDVVLASSLYLPGERNLYGEYDTGSEESLLEELLLGNKSDEKEKEAKMNSREEEFKEASRPDQPSELDENANESFKDPGTLIEDDSNIYAKAQETTEKPMEQADLVKETSRGSAESLETELEPGSKAADEKKDEVSEKMKSNDSQEENREIQQDNLKLESPRENVEEIAQEEADGTTFSKVPLNEPKNSKEVLEGPKADEQQEELFGELLGNTKSPKEDGAEEYGSTETEKDTPLQEENSEDEKRETSESFDDETPLREFLEIRSQKTKFEDDVTAPKAENPAEENERDESGSEEKQSGQPDRNEYVDVATENVRETAPEEGDFEDEVQETKKNEDGDERPPQKNLKEGHNLENAEETIVKAVNPNQDDGNDQETQTQYEESGESLDDETTVLMKSSEPEDQTKVDAEESEPGQDNLQTNDESLLKAEKYKETSDADSNLRAEDPHDERSQETPLQSSFDYRNLKEEQEDVSEKENLEEQLQSTENSAGKSGETLREAFGSLENDEASIEAVNPDLMDKETQSSGETGEETVKLDRTNEENSETSQPEEGPKRQETDGTDESLLRSTLEDQDGADDKEIQQEEKETPSEKLEKNKNLSSDESPETPEGQTDGRENTPPEAQLDNQDYASLEGTNEEETYLKEANPSEKSEHRENEEAAAGAALDPQEEESTEEDPKTTAEVGPNSNEDTEPSLRASLDDSNPENQLAMDGATPSNPEKEGTVDENPRGSSLDDESDEAPLKSANPLEATDSESAKDSEDTLRAEDASDELNNHIEDETPLKAAHFEEAGSNDESDERFIGHEAPRETPSFENLVAEGRGDELREADGQESQNLPSPFSELLQKSDPEKASKLKVPKSIGEIMKDLNGKENNDITAIGNLNPEKIDDIIGKIGEAEQQNFVESQEVDCRKECACADDIDARSRNMGRYEIVKDFLHWMKDLKLNRVLTDD